MVTVVKTETSFTLYQKVPHALRVGMALEMQLWSYINFHTLRLLPYSAGGSTISCYQVTECRKGPRKVRRNNENVVKSFPFRREAYESRLSMKTR